jgi:hypothetical protein
MRGKIGLGEIQNGLQYGQEGILRLRGIRR